MAIKSVLTTGTYEYGNSAFVGSSAQPISINIFIQTFSGQNLLYRGCSLLPVAYENQKLVCGGSYYGVKTIHEARLNEYKASRSQVAHNVWRGIAAILPIIGPIALHINDAIEDFHHKKAILKHPDVRGKVDIIGVAINGHVLKILPMNKVDCLTTDTTTLDSEKRLYLLVSKIQNDLISFGEHFSSQGQKLSPINMPLLNSLNSLDKFNSNKREIKEVKTRIDKLEENKDSLDNQDCKQLDSVALKISDITEYVLKERQKLKIDDQGIVHVNVVP